MFTKKLQIGDKDKEVGLLQEFLREHGYRYIWLREGVVKELKLDNDFGEITESALESWQAKTMDYTTHIYIPVGLRKSYPFEVDGVVDEADRFILNNFDDLLKHYDQIFDVSKEQEKFESIFKEGTLEDRLRKKVVELVLKEVGVKEEYPYKNTGDKVEEYQLDGSCGKLKYSGWAWCQAFANAMIKYACKDLVLEYKGHCEVYTPSAVLWGVNKKIAYKYPSVHQILAGSHGYVHSNKRGGSVIQSVRHVYIPIGVDYSRNLVMTVEGNTNRGGGSNGDGVYKRVRAVSSVKALVDIIKLYK